MGAYKPAYGSSIYSAFQFSFVYAKHKSLYYTILDPNNPTIGGTIYNTFNHPHLDSFITTIFCAHSYSIFYASMESI